MPKFIDLQGLHFGKLYVVRRTENTKQGGAVWECRCDCGTVKPVRSGELRRGDARSCGCGVKEVQRKRLTTHGMSRTRIYKVWRAMHDRCYNPKTRSYKTHGARGIKVCERWHTFENFYEDMGDKPMGKSIERINNDGGYEPLNCKWATPKEQAANRRKAVRIYSEVSV